MTNTWQMHCEVLEKQLEDKEEYIKTLESQLLEYKEKCGEMTRKVGDVIANRAKCPACGEVIESTHVHDYRECSCGKTAVDGGKEYLRRCYDPMVGFYEMSEYLCGKYEPDKL